MAELNQLFNKKIDIEIENLIKHDYIKTAIIKIEDTNTNPISFLIGFALSKILYNTLNKDISKELRNIELLVPGIVKQSLLLYNVATKEYVDDMYEKIKTVKTIDTHSKLKENLDDIYEKIKKVNKHIKQEKINLNEIDMYCKTKIDVELLQLSDSYVGLDSFRLEHELKLNTIYEKINNLDNLVTKNDLNNSLHLDKVKDEINLFRKCIAMQNTNGLDLRLTELEQKINSKVQSKNNNQKLINKINIIENKLSKLSKIEQFDQENEKQFLILNDNIKNLNHQIDLKRLTDKVKTIDTHSKLKDKKIEDLENIIKNLNTSFVKFQSEQNKLNDDKICSIVKHNIDKYIKDNSINFQETKYITVPYNYNMEMYNQQYPVVGN